ncbi:hypothetical protein ACQP1G_15095 [Nocardia sp. CA-107356]|uniref:hypothetical protein n=1 Tax=Nocardia sp. CA-107356 TaxID=3239972 RepID=UPI003D8C1B13
MDHEQGGESIGAMLSSLATTLREVSNKLDAVAAHVDDDRNLAGRLAKLEAWAFRTGEDVSKIGNRLEQVETGPSDEDPAHGEPESRPTPVNRERREPIPSRRDRLDNVNGHSARLETAPGSNGRLEAPTGPHARLEAPTARNNRAESATSRNDRSDTTTGHHEAAPGRNNGLETTTRTETLSGRNDRLAPPDETTSIPTRPTHTEFTAPIARTEHLEPFGPATPNEPVSLPSRTPQPVPPAVPPTYHSEPLATPITHSEPLVAPATRSEWLDSATPGNTESAAPTYTNRLEPPTPTTGDRLDYGSLGSSNGRLEPLTSPPRNGYESPTPRTDSGMTTARAEDNGTLAPGAHRASTGEDTSHVDKLQAMLDELKRNPNGPFGRPEPTTSVSELPGVDPNFAVRTEG